jgi:signal transduction histidine kinase
MGYADLMWDTAQMRNDLAAMQRLEKIRTSGERLLSMITDVLDFARFDDQGVHLDAEDFDVREMALETVANLRASIEKNNNRLEVEVTGAGRVTNDRSKAQQVLSNLLDNAAKFTENGLVRLETQRQTPPNGPERIVFRVIDTGIGIQEQRMQDLFKPFVQLDESISRRYNGAGLGLALSQRLCELMGGEITVESQFGKGSVFTFWLPVEKN